MKIETALYIEKYWKGGRCTVEYKYINIVEKLNVDKFCSTVVEAKEYTPKKGDKLFFLPGCTIPRFKMKKFCEQYGTAMVKYKESATNIFMGPDTIKALVSSAPGYRIDKQDVLRFFRAYANDDFVRKIQNTTSNYVYTSNSLEDVMRSGFGGSPNWSITWCGSAHGTMFKSDTDLATYHHMMKAENIYNQADVARKLNTGAEMDEEQYQSIQRLFQSSDDSNAKVAIEIMSNCDFEKSAVYLLLLIHKFGTKIDSCPTSSHVNFKSLLKFFSINSVTGFGFDNVIDTLITNKLLNRNNLDKVMPIAQELLMRNGMKHFTPTSYDYSEEIYRGLQENILDSTHNTVIVTNEAETLNPKIQFNN